jgi:N-acyl homoserine lactone hydrolase
VPQAVVRRVDFGYFVRPAEETGTGSARPEPCLGYLVDHAGGFVLFDTGMGADPAVDAHYRPRRRALTLALSAVGARLEDIRMVVNCHLHFDHCGGNPELSGRPILVQRAELEAARQTADYTLPELVEAEGLDYEELDGEVEILPGVWVMPTPGHTSGHQSLVVRRDDGTLILAGQTHDTASAFGVDFLVGRAKRDGQTVRLPLPPAWMARLEQLDPARVVFAHDYAVWEP